MTRQIALMLACAARPARRAGARPPRGARPGTAATDRHAARHRRGSERRGDSRRARCSSAEPRPATRAVVEPVDHVRRPGRRDRATGLRPGATLSSVSFPGFETATHRRRPRARRRQPARGDAADRAGSPRASRSAAIRRPRASDPRSERFGNVLTQEQIDALPDDPDEMEAVLKEMAGPGATIRVDGFRGGKLPPKSQIRSIRFSPRHVRGREPRRRHDVRRHRRPQPGLGPLRGSVDFTFRDEALNARNAFQPQKGPEQHAAVHLQSERHAAEGAHVVLAVGRRRRRCTTRRTSSPRCPAARCTDAGAAADRPRQLHRPRRSRAVNKSHTLRAIVPAERQRSAEPRRRRLRPAGSRASRRTRRDSVLRLVGERTARAARGSPSRGSRSAGTTRESSSSLEAPTVRVLDAFTSGGAQQAGGRRSTDIEWATDLDCASGRHAVRSGSLVEGGRYRSDNRTQLPRHLHVREPRRLRGRPAGDLHAARRQSAGRVLALAGRALRAGRLARAQEPDAERRAAPGDPDAPRRSTATWRRAAALTWSPFKSGKTTHPRRRRHLLRLARRGDLRADAARRRRPPAAISSSATRAIPIRSPAARPEVLPPSKYLLADGLVHADARRWRTSASSSSSRRPSG